MLVFPKFGGFLCERARDVLVFLKFCKILVSARFCGVSALTLRLPIQTTLSVAPKLQVFVRPGEKCQKIRKTDTALV